MKELQGLQCQLCFIRETLTAKPPLFLPLLQLSSSITQFSSLLLTLRSHSSPQCNQLF